MPVPDGYNVMPTAQIIGSDDNNNEFASTNVAANADGSVLERLESIKDQVDTVDNFVDTEIAAIKAKTDNLPSDPADESLLEAAIAAAHVVTDGLIVNGMGEGYLVSKEITYNGAASYNAFTVTGLVAVKIIGYITTPLTADAATTSVGTATSAAGLIAATAGNVMDVAGKVWTDNAPSKFEAMTAEKALIGDGEDVVVDGDANLIAGVVTLYCLWKPISADGNVEAAA